MTQEYLLQVNNLSRRYGSQWAVQNLSFEIRRGEVLGFLGPNGAGKSTTMQMITANLAPTTGSVTINGIDLFEQPRAAKALLGYLPEQPPLYKELSVDEFLAFVAKINGIKRGGQSRAIAHVKERCGLGDVSRRLIGNLSKGYQQRVGIALAIIHSPEIVILDEPTVGLDPIQIRSIRELIRELGGDHSVILSTHILPEVQAICDRVQIINRGELVMSDTIDGLMSRMRGASLNVALREPPHVDELRKVSNDIEQIEALAEGHFRIHFQPEHSPAEALVEQAVARGWGLYELTPATRSLEDIFVDITTSESDSELAKESDI
ncbi:MAG: ATP-binding cassette domain-containing protein [Gammaproteobacteria bacterium]|nr:ATP-binding cassette domain-containing protein [Gammaproteobacteria bacterium]